MKYVFSLIILSLGLSSCSNNSEGNVISPQKYSNSVKDSIYSEAKRDFENDSLKYYYSGIASSSPELTKYLKDNFNITIINKIDIADINYSYYNKFTDSILFSKSGKRFTDLYKDIK